MSKIIGRKVRLILASAKIVPLATSLADRHDVGDVLTIVDISPYEYSKWPVQCKSPDYKHDIYKASQLRYLNNKPVKV